MECIEAFGYLREADGRSERKHITKIYHLYKRRKLLYGFFFRNGSLSGLPMLALIFDTKEILPKHYNLSSRMESPGTYLVSKYSYTRAT